MVFVSFIWITACAVRAVVLECDTIPKTRQELKKEKKEVRRSDAREQNFIALLRSAQRWHGDKEKTGNNDHPTIQKS